MARNVAYVRIDGEPFLSRAKEYRAKRYAALEAWSAFAKEMGANSIPGGLRGLNFSRKAPDGWTKPTGRDGYSKPKKGHPDVARIDALRAEHPMPSGTDVFGDAICWNLNWKGERGYGGGLIGLMFEAQIGWAGDTFYCLIPDAEAAVRQHREQYPEHTIEEPAASWRVPDGLTRLTEAEYDLAFAQAAVDEERAKSAA